MVGFWQYVLLGLGVGGIYALAAQGIVLVYRGSGIINFALGGMAMVGAYTYIEVAEAGAPLFFSMLVAVVASALLGALMYVLVFRRLHSATQLTKLGAVLGVQATIVGAMLWRYGDAQTPAPDILPTGSTGWISDLFGDGVRVGADRIWLLGIGAITCLICWSAYRYTRFGLTTRAVAEKPMIAASLGHSPDQVAAINWAVGGAFLGLSGVLLAGINNASIVQFNLLLVPALAAALVGRFTSFPLTWVAGITIGVAQTVISSEQSWIPSLLREPGWSSAVPFLVIIGLLVVTGQGLPSRGHVLQRAAHAGTGRVRPGFVVPIFVITMLLSSAMSIDWVLAITYSSAMTIIAMSIIVVTGYAGQLSLAQLTLAGFGAFVAARIVGGQPLLGIDFGGPRPFVVGIVASVVLTAAAGLLVALPALRTRGFSLAIATLGFALVVDEVIFSNTRYTGGAAGTIVAPPSIFGMDIDPVVHPDRYLVFAVTVLLVVGLIVANLRRSGSGRRLLAVRSNERAAASLGISVGGAKAYAFAVAAGIAAFGGVILAFRNSSILLEGYGVNGSILLLVSTLLGGIAYVGSAFMAGSIGPGSIGGRLLDPIVGTNPVMPVLVGLTVCIMLVRHPDGVMRAFVEGARTLGAVIRGWLPGPVRRIMYRRSRRATSAVPDLDPEPVAPKSLVITGLSVRFGAVRALEDAEVVVEPGTITGLIGPNGAGKTTLLDAATGFSRHQEGSILLDGVEIGGWSPRRRARAGLSRSFQSLELFETLTVEDHVRLAAESARAWEWMRDLVWARRRPLPDQAAVVLHELGLFDEIDRTPEELSQGRRRLLAIARAAAARPSVLLLDEPAAGLDEHESAELGRLLTRLATKWGIAILLVEHDVELVMSVCDRITVLEFGRVIADGPPQEVRRSQAVIDAYVGTADQSEEQEQGIDLLPAGPPRRSVSPSGPPILAARGLTAGYGKLAVVRDVQIEVRPGEVVALLGPNGAGKTTSLLTLAGALAPIDGDVLWDGESVNGSPLHRRAIAGLALVPEERSIFMDLTTMENLRVADGDPDRVLALFPELQEKLHHKAGLLSGGQQQMLALGRMLATDPKVLLADELSLGLAPLIVQRLLSEVRAAADRGAGVLLVEQHAQAALAVADRVYLMQRGQVVMEGSSADIAGRLDEVRDIYLAAKAEEGVDVLA